MPLHWSTAHCGGAWVITGYEEVAAALRDPRFSVRRAARWINSGLGESGNGQQDEAQRQFKRLFSRSLLFLDGRAHRRLRGVLNPGFKPADLQARRGDITALAQRLADDIVTDPQAARGFDFIARFARPLPALVIAQLLGLPDRVPAEFIDWAADLAAFIGSPTPDATQTLAAQQAMRNLRDFFSQALARADELPEACLLRGLLQAHASGQLNRTELLAQCSTLLFAGYETTRNLLGNGVLALLQDPAQWAALKARQADPAALRLAVREMLRHDSPVQYTGRRLLQEVSLAGQRLQRGQLAILHIGQANHDARRFRDPQRFDIRRDEGMHLSFGQGPHVCLGAALTQLEAEIAFSVLMQRLPTLSLADETLVWQGNAAYRALDRLSVIF
ncbi:cytochrome P450 [Herbaspirillum sp.]|jgi:cytochrome P450|uniref:cytochrome P450 n=1 Tax=Herbaspirillum TaxID=963 RepID=UPI002585AFC3|nr:cytochrome P450 [Herbaspirillum sp.]MCP3653778.1 cytochrome P450 [Herbaspirillum sp.]MCP3947844.1 cytochrome P450 [Herbaspirillum sp.]MCP4032661.1 cytochrome P450 [Herbaspirillum sp.]MCP4555735.1 cytochrome P450 [Herbaspirillum sp.]